MAMGEGNSKERMKRLEQMLQLAKKAEETRGEFLRLLCREVEANELVGALRAEIDHSDKLVGMLEHHIATWCGPAVDSEAVNCLARAVLHAERRTFLPSLTEGSVSWPINFSFVHTGTRNGSGQPSTPLGLQKTLMESTFFGEKADETTAYVTALSEVAPLRASAVRAYKEALLQSSFAACQKSTLPCQNTHNRVSNELDGCGEASLI